MYSVNENEGAKAHFAFQFFLLPLLHNTYVNFSSEFSQQLLDLGL